MHTIRTGLLALAVGLLGASCGDSEDDKGAPAVTGGGGAGGDATAGGGATSTGGRAATGGAAGEGGAGGAPATGGTGGTMSPEETCAAVCDLLASATTPLTCVPDPCQGTCVSEYSQVVVADAVCGAAYLDVLNCGLSQPADSWTCYQIPQTTVSIPVPPAATDTDACYVQVQTLYLAILGSNPCLTAFMTMP